MGSQAKKFEGSVHSFTASTFNSCRCFCRRALGGLAAVLGVRGMLALAAILIAIVGSVPTPAQAVQFFGSFSSYQQELVTNAQGLVANSSGNLYVTGFSDIGYIPVDANGNPNIGAETYIDNNNYKASHAMGLAIDTSNNLFRVDPTKAQVEMFAYAGSTTNFTRSTLGAGWTKPSSVTVDSSGNVYVLDAGTGTIVELTANGGYAQSNVFTDPALVNTTGLSIDSAGNFYVASGPVYGTYSLSDSTPPAVYKITNNAGSYSLSTIDGPPWLSPSATTVDAAGNLWVVDYVAGTINLLVRNGDGSFAPPIVYQSIPNIRTLMINQAGRIYGFGYSTGVGDAVIWTGGTPPHNLGTYNVGMAAPTVTLTVDFMSPATLGGINVTTQGASGGDFQDTGGGSCAVAVGTAPANCTVVVAFTPNAPGLRTGALVVTDYGGNVLGTNYFYGVGTAPSIAFHPGTFSTVIPQSPALVAPFGAALDQAGNLYVTDTAKKTLYKFAGGSTTATVLDSAFNGPVGMTVDGAGNLWVADCDNHDVVLETLTGPGAYAPSVLPFSGLSCPYDVAVDGSGNVYVADLGSGSVLKETLNNGSYSQSTVVSGLTAPMAVAVDSSSHVYVADTSNNRVLEETPSGTGYTQTIVANSGLNQPEGLAIDPNGNVYISDSSNSRIVKAKPSGATFVQFTLPITGMNRPAALALDAAGDLYIVDQNTAVVDELNISTAPTFAFATTVAGSVSPDSQATLFNYGNAALNISTINFPAGFSSNASTCALSSEVLAPNTSCSMGIVFTPTSGVPYGDSVGLTDNNMNGVNVIQNIGVSGTGAPDIILSPASLPAGTAGVAYNQPLSATGGVSPYTYTVTITGGAMPAGMNFSSGVLSGTPSSSGTVTFSIMATDSSTPASYSSSIQTYSLTIAAAPVVISISPASLPDGAVGIAYSQTVTASGGSGSYSYALTSGGLPAGMLLNASSGLVSGTPTVSSPDPISFTITAIDTINSVSASQPYTPTIYAVASAALAQNAGPSNIGSPASTTTLIFSFNVPATVASINVVTQGAANQDFTNADAGTCTGVHSATSTCAVDVTFTPQYAGARYGAVLLEDASGDVLGTALIDGIGAGPQLDFGARTATATAFAPTVNALALGKPTGIAMDGAGDLFIADIENNRIVEMPAGGGAALAIAPIVDGRPLHKPGGLVVDGAGNLFIADVYNWRVVEVPAGGGAAIAIAPAVDETPLNNPVDIALDGAGNLFIADTWNNRIVEVSASGAVTAIAPTVNDTTLNRPSGIAVDSMGNLFISDTLNARVVEVPFNGGAAISVAPTVNAIALNHPSGVVVDAAGNLFIADTLNNRVVKVPGDGSAAVAFVPAANGATLVQPNGLALDGAGDLFVSDHGNSRVIELQRSLPPILSFASTAVGVKSSDSPQFVAVENTGNATLTFSGLSTVTDFPLDNSGASVCTSTTSLAAGARCTLPIDFLPATAGARNGTLALIDNSLGGNSVTQNIFLSGAAIQATPTLTWPTASAISYGQTLASSTLSGGTSTPAGTFTWTTASTAPGAGTASESVTFTPTDTADYNSATGTASVTVNKATATVTLTGLTQTYTGSALVATATTTPDSLSVSFTYNGNSTAPTAPGSYTVVGSISDANYTGTATGTMTISKATAVVTLAGLSQTYTGSALAATATTTPGSLSVSLTYNGSSTIPMLAGSYTVVGTISDANYGGSATGTMTISKATAVVTLAGLSQTYTGLPFAATATTSPTSLSVSLTYSQNGLPVAAPTGAGSFAVTATITDPNYTGTASGTLSIGQAAATVTLAALSQTYTGLTLAATATTNPGGLTVSLTYNGSSTVPTAPNSYTVVGTITNPNYTGTATGTMTISKAAATVALAGLSQPYTGSALAAIATTSPVGLTVSLTYDGSSTAPTAAGSYAVVGTINDANYTGTATGTMTISKAAGTITLSRLSQIYTGSALAATATTNPASLTVSLTYNGSSTAPTAAGSYAVVGTIDDTNYQGAASGTMTISQAAATVTLSRLSQTYTGSALAATATTNPAGLNVSLTYNGSSTVPTGVGSYAVVGTISDTNYMGTAGGTLVIGTAATAVSVAASANPAALMGFGTLTATVSSAAGTPPGEVSFFDGTTLLGSATVSGGVATFPTATLATGTHSITATYVASSDFTGSSSNPLALSVVDLSLGNTGNGGSGSTGDSQTTTPGGSASYTVALAPSAGTTFPSPIILSVTGLPLGATATLGTPGWTMQSPTMWTLPANQPVSNISLKFQMPEQMAAAEPSDGPASKLPLVAVGLLLLPFARKWRKAGNRMSGWLCLLLIAVGITAATGATGCGGSATQPSQTYNVKVTVTAGALIHTTQLTLTVK
jgi:sugar lactone lactonase YvrE